MHVPCYSFFKIGAHLNLQVSDLEGLSVSCSFVNRV